MKTLLATVVATTLIAGAATAQDRSATFLDLLSTAPAAAFLQDAPDRIEIEFGDARAALPAAFVSFATGNLGFSPQEAALSRALPADMRQQIFRAINGAMRDSLGIDATDIETVLRVAVLPRRFISLTLADGTAESLVAALEANGLAREDRGAMTVLSFGDDFEINAARRDPSNLFSGALGQSDRYAVDGNTVRHSFDWDTMEAALDPAGQSLLDALPEVQTLAAGLDLLPTDLGPLAFTYVFVQPGRGSLMIADLSTPAANTGALIITLADTATAEAMASHVQERWETAQSLLARRTYAALLPGELRVAVAPGTPAALVVSVAAAPDPEDRLFRNQTHETMFLMFASDDLTPLFGELPFE